MSKIRSEAAIKREFSAAAKYIKKYEEIMDTLLLDLREYKEKWGSENTEFLSFVSLLRISGILLYNTEKKYRKKIEEFDVAQ